MNLTLFFKLITQVIFSEKQISFCDYTRNNYVKPDYKTCLFYCPRVYAKDGFNVSLQIHNGNYCESENGYRKLGKEWIKVEFGFPSENEILMHPYSEMYGYDDNYEELEDKTAFNVMGTVGSIPVSVMEEVFEKHGGIDWVKSTEFQDK